MWRLTRTLPLPSTTLRHCIRHEHGHGQKPPGTMQPLTKMWHTMRGLYKVHRANQDLKVKVAAQMEAAKKAKEKYEFAQERVTRALTDGFSEKVEYLMEGERKKNDVRSALLEQQLSKVTINKQALEASVKGKLLDKWETVLSNGGAAALTQAAKGAGAAGAAGAAGGGGGDKGSGSGSRTGVGGKR